MKNQFIKYIFIHFGRVKKNKLEIGACEKNIYLIHANI